jgi:teichuronic acid biosynthesis glycosyltransferase TuaG
MGGERTPVVSVVTPAFNAERLIGEMVASVRAQTLQDWELLVVDDCSTDDTVEAVQRASAADPRVRLLESRANGGAAASRNVGLAEARGRFIAFLDADDLWDPSKLERQVAFHVTYGAAFTFTGYRVISTTGNVLGHVPVGRERLAYRDMLRGQRVGCLTVMLDRDRLVGPIRFPEEQGPEDFALWLDLLRNGAVAKALPDELASYRVVQGSSSRNKLRAARLAWRVYRRQPISWAAAVWYYAHYCVDSVVKHFSSGAHRAVSR